MMGARGGPPVPPGDDTMTHVDDRVSISELADAIRLQKSQRAQRPWWVSFVGQVGVGAVFAYMLLKFVTVDMSNDQKMILENTGVNRTVMAQASRDMTAFTARDEAWKEVMLMVARQTCRNAVPTNSPTARDDRDACDVIRTPR
jgi:hypothetical protein